MQSRNQIQSVLRRHCYSVPGPDFLWHTYGYDKLKPYGFSIHGCIDRFSRQIIWLKVAKNNKNSSAIASYYYSVVREMGGVPTRIRSDDGTENSIIEPIQIFLRSAHDDEFAGIGSFLKGTSLANQRIESLWSQLARDRPMQWRQFFAELFSELKNSVSKNLLVLFQNPVKPQIICNQQMKDYICTLFYQRQQQLTVNIEVSVFWCFKCILLFGHRNILIKKIPKKDIVTTVKQNLIAVREIHCTKNDVSHKVFFSKFEQIRIFCRFVQIY